MRGFRVRVLEDHLHRARVALRQGLDLVDHLARGLAMHAQHGLAEGGVAGGAPADEADDFARGDVEAHVVHGVHDLVAPDASPAISSTARLSGMLQGPRLRHTRRTPSDPLVENRGLTRHVDVRGLTQGADRGGSCAKQVRPSGID